MAKRLRISGKVQGVGFRFAMADQAEQLGVTGWVRNRADGTVEAVVDGAPQALEAIIAWARRGPRAAQVTGFEIEDVAGGFDRFELRPTE